MEIQGDSSLVQLPALALQRIVCRVEARELAILCCTCRELNDICSEPWLWRSLCMKRWKHRQTDLWKEHWRASSFKTLYGAKDRVDKSTEALAQDLKSIREKPVDCTLKLYRLGQDAFEKGCSIYQSMEAQFFQPDWLKAVIAVQGRHVTEGLVALIGRLATEEVPVEEGALLIAQIFYPFSDLSGISKYLDKLGTELKMQMAAAEISGGIRALRMLSSFLFARRNQVPEEALQSHDRLVDHGVERVWHWEGESELEVPSSGGSLNLRVGDFIARKDVSLKGSDSRDYSHPANSMIPAVLRTKQGLPITLCIIHAAIGRRVGLDIQGANVPMHFLNKYTDGNDTFYIDCFNGGRILPSEEVPAPWPGTPTFECNAQSIWQRCIRNLIGSLGGHTMRVSTLRLMLLLIGDRFTPADIESSTWGFLSEVWIDFFESRQTNPAYSAPSLW